MALLSLPNSLGTIQGRHAEARNNKAFFDHFWLPHCTKERTLQWGGITLAVFCALQPSWSFAATPDPILQNQQQQLEQQRQELFKRPDVFLLPSAIAPAPTPAAPPEELCFHVQRIELEGAPDTWMSWLRPLVAPLEGQCLGVKPIQALVEQLTNSLVQHGYVTSRVYLPNQNLKLGVLKLTVVPGRLGLIRVKEGGGDLSLRAAFPIDSGDILNLRALEQGLEQLSRPSSQHATMEIVPGKEPGWSDVVVTRERGKSWIVSYSEDDSGQRATGKLQGNVVVGVDNVIGMNDTLTLSRSQDVEQFGDPRTYANTVSWVLPWGSWTGLTSYSESAYHQTIQGANQTFTASGHSRNTYFSLSRLLDRGQSSKTELALQLTRKASRSFLADVEIQQQRSDLTSLGLELSHRHHFDAWLFDGALGYRRELDIWGAMPDNLVRQGGPSARAEIWNTRLTFSSPFRIGQQSLSWKTEFKGQYSPDRLLGSEQFSIGSRYTVRGFDQNSLSGQSGFYVRNELAWTLMPPSGQGRSLDSFVGLDVGQVSGQTGSDWHTNTLSGWAAGLRATLSPGVTAELVHERALHQPEDWHRPAITHFRVALQY